MKEIDYVKLESSDGEIHFQECTDDFCSKSQKYTEEEALELAKNDTRKTLILHRK